MTQRLHPEDLRTIVAAIQCLDPHYPGVGSRSCVQRADALLAELAKTAKPEAEPEEQTIHGIPARSAANHWHDKFQEAEQQASELRNKLTAATAQLETVEDRANKFQASYDHMSKAWNYNVNKWSKIIDSRYCYDEPEVILDIDRALEQGIKDAARVKELEAALQTARADSDTLNKLGHALGCCYCTDQGCYTAEPEALMERAKVLCQIEQNDWDKHAAVVKARAEGAKEERERIVRMLKTNHFMVFRWDCHLPMGVAEFEKFLEPKP